MNKTALIVIDVQNYFVNEHTKDIPEKIAHFLSENRFDFILFTKFVNRTSSNFFKLLDWKKCVGSPDTDIHHSLEKFVRKDNLFEKASYSIFKTDLSFSHSGKRLDNAALEIIKKNLVKKEFAAT